MSKITEVFHTPATVSEPGNMLLTRDDDGQLLYDRATVGWRSHPEIAMLAIASAAGLPPPPPQDIDHDFLVVPLACALGAIAERRGIHDLLVRWGGVLVPAEVLLQRVAEAVAFPFPDSPEKRDNHTIRVRCGGWLGPGAPE